MTVTTSSKRCDESGPIGSVEPRLWTPPLRDLTPDTSFGYEVIKFAEWIGVPLDPWQQWLVIHAGELLTDGRPRFRTLLVLVARQNGKTTLLRVLSLFWLFVDLVDEASPVAPATILGTSSKLDYAKESWELAVATARAHKVLREEVPKDGVRKSNGEQTLSTIYSTRYKISAANDDAGRSLTIHRLVLDELRQHKDWVCWAAATNTTNAVRGAQIWAISNQGGDDAVVLDSLRTSAISFIETGEGDYRHGLFEYSSPVGSDPTDLAALAQANPNLGHRIDVDAIIGEAVRAKEAGGEQLAAFRTEVMCMRVPRTNPAIDPDAWDAAGTDEPLDLAAHRDRVALCADVALDGRHATLAAAALVDGVVHVETIAAWSGLGCTRAMRAELPDHVARVRPARFGWFPQGPAAAVAADLAKPKDKRRRPWPPRGVKVEAITADLPAACMGLAEQVIAGDLRHARDPMLTAHVQASQKLPRGEGQFVFTRTGADAIDGAYALAGAVHIARTMPPPRAPLTPV